MARSGIPAEADPRKTSPKVKWGAVVSGVLTIVASAVAAIPAETWATLGEAGLPIGMAVGATAYGVTAYLKSDPAREPTTVTETVVAPPVQQDPADLVLREDEAVVETTDPVLPGARLVGKPGAGVYVYGDDSVGVPVRRVASTDPFEELRRRLDG